MKNRVVVLREELVVEVAAVAVDSEVQRKSDISRRAHMIVLTYFVYCRGALLDLQRLLASQCNI